MPIDKPRLNQLNTYARSHAGELRVTVQCEVSALSLNVVKRVGNGHLYRGRSARSPTFRTSRPPNRSLTALSAKCESTTSCMNAIARHRALSPSCALEASLHPAPREI
jgi:hypothetical protein